MDDNVQDFTNLCCLRGLAFCRASWVDPILMTRNSLQLNRTRRTLFLLLVSDGNVTIADKPAFFTRPEIDNNPAGDPGILRVHLYREFIEQAIRISGRLRNDHCARRK